MVLSVPMRDVTIVALALLWLISLLGMVYWGSWRYPRWKKLGEFFRMWDNEYQWSRDLVVVTVYVLWTLLVFILLSILWR